MAASGCLASSLASKPSPGIHIPRHPHHPRHPRTHEAHRRQHIRRRHRQHRRPRHGSRPAAAGAGLLRPAVRLPRRRVQPPRDQAVLQRHDLRRQPLPVNLL
ncbi:hypothetical protein GQ42DRAFT_160567, partial [Ramicandelaber brevisporus]